MSWDSVFYFSHSIQNVEGSENGAAAVITATSSSASSYDHTFWFNTTVDSSTSEAKSYLIAVRAKASKNITSNLPTYMCYCHPTGSTSKTAISFSFPITTEWQIFYTIVNIPANYYMYDNTLAFYRTGDGITYYVDWMAAYDITGSSFANMTFGARATAYSEHVRSGKTFYKDGILYGGTMEDATVSIDSNNGITIDSNTGIITAKATYNSGYVTSGSTSNTKQLTTKGATNWTPGRDIQTIAAGTYLTGTQTIKGDSNLIASNIKNGVSIFGVAGTYSGNSSAWSMEEGFGTPNSDSKYLYINGITRDDPYMLIVLSAITPEVGYSYGYVVNMLYARDWYVRSGQYHWQSIFVEQYDNGEDTWAQLGEWDAGDAHYEFYMEDDEFVLHLNTTGGDRFKKRE